MEYLNYDTLDSILDQCCLNGYLYFGMICACSYLARFGRDRKNRVRRLTIHDGIEKDSIECVALHIYTGFNINDCILLSLLNGKIRISWWLWCQHRPYLTIRILIDIERHMAHHSNFECIDLLYDLIRKIQCAHEAAHFTFTS